MQQDISNISPIKAIHDLARRNKIFANYQLVNESGPAHAKQYTIRLHLGEKEYVGTDRSIKLAQRAAAQIALEDHKHSSSINNLDQDILQINNKSQSPTVILNTWTVRHHIPTEYVFLNEEYFPPSPNLSWKHPRIIFYYRLYFGHNLYFDGNGSSHQQARTNCAYQALHFIRQNPIPIITTTSLPLIETKSQISLMYERAKQLKLSVQIVYPDPLTVTYNIGEQYSATSSASTKHAAKKLAAEKMLEILPLANEKEKVEHNNRKRSNQRTKFIEQKGLIDYSLSKEINPITRLYQIARARNIKIEFNEVEKLSEENVFHFHVKSNENDFACGCGRNKQTAKRLAAENLLAKLNPDLLGSISIVTTSVLPPPPTKGLLKRDENSNKQQEKKHVHFVEDQLVQQEEHPVSITIKQQLINACEKLNINIQYQDELISNDNNQYESIVSLSKDDRLLAQFRGKDSSVMSAQENASTAAWNNLQELFNGSIRTPKATINKRYRRVQTPLPIQQ